MQPMKHPLKFVQDHGMLAEGLGLSKEDCAKIEALVEQSISQRKNMRELFEAVGDLDISDELWANFLYTFGWWDATQRG